MTRNILIAVTGLTPQIVTSTLYCLNKQKNVNIDEIIIITTSKGRDVLTGKDKVFKYPALKKMITDMCKKFGFDEPRFNESKNIIVAEEESLEIPDMRSEEANRIFPNVVCNVVKEKAADIYNTLYCSISGGRKSMGAYLSLAISLFGKENDKLIHVLTTPENEKNKLPYPQNKKQEKEFDLTEIPFVKLRNLLNDFLRKESEMNKLMKRKIKYSDIVEITQNRLTKDILVINKKNGNIYFGDNESKHLSPVQIELYLKIIDEKRKGNSSVPCEELFSLVNLKNIEKAHRNFLSNVSKVNLTIKEAIGDTDKEAQFLIQGPGVYGKGNYGIPADISQFEFIEK